MNSLSEGCALRFLFDCNISQIKKSLQMLEVGQLEDLGWDGGQTVAVQPKNLQTARQVGEAARLQ